MDLLNAVSTGLAFGGISVDMELSEYLNNILAGKQTVKSACQRLYDTYVSVCGYQSVDGYSSFNSYFYPNTDVLANKLCLRSRALLSRLDGKFSGVRMLGLLMNQTPEDFSVEYFRSIHEFLFRDLYDWAGMYRKCDMGLTDPYVAPDAIDSRLRDFCYEFKSEFVERDFPDKYNMSFVLAQEWGKLDKIHPFRDGCGRCEYVFFRMACLKKGFDLIVPESDLQVPLSVRRLAAFGRDGSLRDLLQCSLRSI